MKDFPLSRLRTDHIDYYLMHMFTDYAEWEHLRAPGIEGWIERQKAEGHIHNIGFSYHGDTDMFLRILNAYDWDFCPARFGFVQNIGLRREPGFASRCIGCGKCEKHCPQHINTREKLKEANHDLRPLPYKIGIHILRKIMINKRSTKENAM